MPILGQLLGAFLLLAYAAVWWLAVWVVCGESFGFFQWVPVAFLAFVVPAMLQAPGSPVAGETWPVFAWLLLGLVIDFTWVIARWWRGRKQPTGE